MKYSTKKSENTHVRSILFGLAAALLSIILCSMLLSTFVISGSIKENKLEVGTMIILFVSAMIGSLSVRYARGEGSPGIILIYLVTIVVLLMLVNVVFFGARFRQLLLKTGMLMAGSFVGMLKRRDRGKKFAYGKNR